MPSGKFNPKGRPTASRARARSARQSRRQKAARQRKAWQKRYLHKGPLKGLYLQKNLTKVIETKKSQGWIVYPVNKDSSGAIIPHGTEGWGPKRTTQLQTQTQYLAKNVLCKFFVPQSFICHQDSEDARRSEQYMMTEIFGTMDGLSNAELENPVIKLMGGKSDMANFQEQDLAIKDRCVDGKSIFGRYLTMKFRVEYPSGDDSPFPPAPRPLRLIWGWCAPLLNPPQITGQQRKDCQRYKQTLSEIRAHVINQVAYNYDQRKEFLEFGDRKERGRYKIIGQRTIRPNRRGNAVPTAAAGKVVGMPITDTPTGPIHTSITWRCMKKINLTEAQADPLINDDADPPEYMYPNESWLPFAMIVNPDSDRYRDPTGTEDDANKYLPKVEWSECFWFNDA